MTGPRVPLARGILVLAACALLMASALVAGPLPSPSPSPRRSPLPQASPSPLRSPATMKTELSPNSTTTSLPTPAFPATAVPTINNRVAEKPIQRDADIEHATLVRPPLSLENVQIDEVNLEVQTEHLGKGLIPYVMISGHYKRPYGSMLVGYGVVRLSEDSDFNYKLVLTGPSTSVRFVDVSPLGDVNEEYAHVEFPGYETLMQTGGKEIPRGWGFQAGAQLSFLSYSENLVHLYSGSAITAKISGKYTVAASQWDIQGNMFATAIPLGSNLTDTTVRFFGANLRGGVRADVKGTPWSFIGAFGYYYTRMFVSGGQFGYADVGGPEIFPIAIYHLNNGSIASGYFKYSPISDGTSLMDFGNRELAFGLRYTPKPSTRHPISYVFDLADMSATILGVPVHSSSFSFGADYGF